MTRQSFWLNRDYVLEQIKNKMVNNNPIMVIGRRNENKNRELQ